MIYAHHGKTAEVRYAPALVETEVHFAYEIRTNGQTLLAPAAANIGGCGWTC